jgi:hypothetical protein
MGIKGSRKKGWNFRRILVCWATITQKEMRFHKKPWSEKIILL